jgi:DNA (cytosine-5)-methyltransferase 1
MQVDISSFPHWVARPPLSRFLEHPGKPLSARATAGFLRRASMSKNLNFRSGFLDRLERHRDAMAVTR